MTPVVADDGATVDVGSVTVGASPRSRRRSLGEQDATTDMASDASTSALPTVRGPPSHPDEILARGGTGTDRGYTVPVQTVLVTGATGYIGGRLVPVLLDAGHAVRCLVRTPSKLTAVDWADQVDVVAGDIGDPAIGPPRPWTGAMAAYFLVHSMGGDDDFAAQDRQHAQVFADAAADTADDGADRLPGRARRGDRRPVAPPGQPPRGRTDPRGGPGAGHRAAGRGDHRVGVGQLRDAAQPGRGPPGDGHPEVGRHPVQPIAIRDILHALRVVLERSDTIGRVVEVGGPDVLTYREMMHTYAEVAGLRRRRHRARAGAVARPVEPLGRPGDPTAPRPGRCPWSRAWSTRSSSTTTRSTCSRTWTSRPTAGTASASASRSSWRCAASRTSRSTPAGPTPPCRASSPADPAALRPRLVRAARVLTDEQTAAVADATPAQVFAAVSGIGGDRGWFVADLLWTLRGVADKAVGGPGMRRGRRDPDRLRVGDALDFWRVEAAEPPSASSSAALLRLRAEMKLPGEAWLEWRIDADGGSAETGTTVVQRAIFVPRGLFGRLYWYAWRRSTG